MNTLFRNGSLVAGLILVSNGAHGAASPGLTKIYESFVVSAIAATRCAPPDAETQKKFINNFTIVSAFARKELKARFPNSPEEVIDTALKEQANKLTKKVDEVIQSDGCKDEKIQKLLEAYRYHADWNATAPPPPK